MSTASPLVDDHVVHHHHPMRSSLEPSAMRDSLSSMPPAPKRRAFSVSDRGLYRGASSSATAARRAVSSALSNVTRFVRSSSNGSNSSMAGACEGDNDADNTTMTTASENGRPPSAGSLSMIDDPTNDDAPTAGTRARSYSATISSWKISSKLPQVPATLKNLRRPRQLSMRRGSTSSTSTALLPWNQGHVQYVSSSYALHGEDAGAISSYYHIVADGISAPFAGQAPHTIPTDRVGSDVIAQALVRAVEQALEDATDRNKQPLDAAAFEHTVCDAIRATRALCAKHKQSRIATTLCVAYFDRWHSQLLSFTLGDSKCIVVRQGDLVFESTCTVREFNVPCVVNLSQPLEPNDYLVESFALAQGDICLSFSDGIGDNLYKDDVLLALETLENDPASITLQQICETLVAQATLDGGAGGTAAAAIASPPSSVSSDKPNPATDLSASSVAEPEAELTGSENPPVAVSCPTETLRERLDSSSMMDDTPTGAHATPEASEAPVAPAAPAAPLETPAAPPSETDQTQSPESRSSQKKRFYPFATAAAYEYRRRVLRQKSIAPPDMLADKNFQRHVRDSALLLDLHDGKNVIDRQVLVAKAHRRPHYSLVQLHRMAQIRAMKHDDVTLQISRFA